MALLHILIPNNKHMEAGNTIGTQDLQVPRKSPPKCRPAQKTGT